MAAPVRTLFFGSGPVALPVLARLLESDLVTVDSVVTAPPRPAGRRQVLTPTPVADLAVAHGLPVRSPVSLRDAAVVDELRASDPGLIVLADYGRIIPGTVLALPPRGALNVHPSLLPRHRGAAPVVGTILAGDGVGGVTVMAMDEGLDTGPIVAQAEIALDGTETAPELEARLAGLGADLLIATLPAWLEGTLRAQPQPAEGISLTRQLRREDGRLDPRLPAVELERQVRAYQPWPGSFIELGDEGSSAERLKVWAASIPDQPVSGDAGALVPVDETLGLVTTDGVLKLDEVQPAGKRRMRGADYRRGRRS